MKNRLFISSLLFLLASALTAPAAAPKEPPSFADIAYGPDPKQKLDVYVPPGAGPFPVVLYIHGGGWFAGDKVTGCMEPAPFLKVGCALVSIEYRLIKDAVAENISPPIAAVLGDNRRALQYVRLHAADWHLDPDKIVVAGGSAGAASALFIGAEGEQANPQSADPVERVSTQVLGVGAAAAQSSIDPKVVNEWVPGCYWGYWAFDGSKAPAPPPEQAAVFQHFLSIRDTLLPTIEKYSPDALLSAGAPPIFMQYGQPLPPPSPPTPSNGLVHCPLWGVGYQKLAQSKGVECYLQYPGHPAEKYKGLTEFLLHQLGVKGY